MNKKLFDPEKVEQLIQDMLRHVPPAFGELREELQQNFRACIESFLNKMDLVSREEYDIQTALLAKLRKRVQDLEKRLDEIDPQDSK